MVEGRRDEEWMKGEANEQKRRSADYMPWLAEDEIFRKKIIFHFLEIDQNFLKILRNFVETLRNFLEMARKDIWWCQM